MAEVCCFCDSKVIQGTMKIKSKKLVGHSTQDTLMIVNDIALR
jgi:hypothetical protein